MPLYEYQCQRCGHVMEVLQKFSDPPRRKCEKCSGKVEKLVSRTSFQLKGGGWFNEGYGGGSKGSKSSSSKAAKPSKKSSGGSGNGKEGKSAATS